MEPSTIAAWLSQFGFAGTLSLATAWVIFKFGPRAAEAYIQFLGVATDTMKANTQVLGQIRDELLQQNDRLQGLEAAGRHAADAAAVLARGTPREDEVRPHLETIRSALVR